jgi:hypothetical protein
LGAQKATVHAIALPAELSPSSRPQAQSYWMWLNKRLANAPKRLQMLFQDVMERADNLMLEQFLADFADWSLRQRQASGSDDASQHPAPYKEGLRRPASVTTGLVVCPTLVSGKEILSRVGAGEKMVVVADDNRDFLPPIMTYEEEDAQVDAALRKVVDEAELSPAGKKELENMLKKHRTAFGMQLRKVNFDQEPVHTYTTGEMPEHQPRRIIRDPRVRGSDPLGRRDEGARRGGRADVQGPRKSAPDQYSPRYSELQDSLHCRRAHAKRRDHYGFVPGAVPAGGAGAFSSQQDVLDI